jgi:hypothetical protein
VIGANACALFGQAILGSGRIIGKSYGIAMQAIEMLYHRKAVGFALLQKPQVCFKVRSGARHRNASESNCRTKD